MNKGDKDYLGYGAIIGIFACILLIGAILTGVYATSIYSDMKVEQNIRAQMIKAEKAAQAQAWLAERNSQIYQGTIKCNKLGYNSFDIDRNVCYSELNIDYQQRYKSNYYEELAMN